MIHKLNRLASGRPWHALAVALIITATAVQANHGQGNIVQRLERDGRFTILLTALEAAGLKDTVATGSTFTVFAPTDEAFDKLPPGRVEGLLANTNALRNVLLYHVVSGDQSAKELLRARSVETLQGANVHVYWWWGRVFVNRSQVIDADIAAGNGTVHAINKVLLPNR